MDELVDQEADLSRSLERATSRAIELESRLVIANEARDGMEQRLQEARTNQGQASTELEASSGLQVDPTNVWRKRRREHQGSPSVSRGSNISSRSGRGNWRRRLVKPMRPGNSEMRSRSWLRGSSIEG